MRRKGPVHTCRGHSKTAPRALFPRDMIRYAQMIFAGEADLSEADNDFQGRNRIGAGAKMGTRGFPRQLAEHVSAPVAGADAIAAGRYSAST